MDRDDLAVLLLSHSEKRTALGHHVGCRCGQRPTLAAQASGDEQMAQTDWANHLADELVAEVDRLLAEVTEGW